MLLSIAVDTPIPLLQPIRVEGQLHVDQVVATVMKVEALGSRIGADEDQALLLAEPLGDGLPDLVGVVATHRQHCASSSMSPFCMAMNLACRLGSGFTGIGRTTRSLKSGCLVTGSTTCLFRRRTT